MGAGQKYYGTFMQWNIYEAVTNNEVLMGNNLKGLLLR